MKVVTIKAKQVKHDIAKTQNTRKLLHEILLNIQKQYGQNKLRDGICGEVKLRLPNTELIHKTTHALEMLFKRWPEYSGDEVFPVPSCSTELDVREAYHELPLWYTGEYAAARLRLLDYLIEQTK